MNRIERAAKIMQLPLEEFREHARWRAWRKNRFFDRAAPPSGWPLGINGKKFIRNYVTEVLRS